MLPFLARILLMTIYRFFLQNELLPSRGFHGDSRRTFDSASQRHGVSNFGGADQHSLSKGDDRESSWVDD